MEPEEQESIEEETIDGDPHGSFPWGPVRAAGALILVHLGVLGFAGMPPEGGGYVRLGGLVAGESLFREPWRLLTSLFLHSGPSHVLWNGLSMVVFAVPLILELGYPATASIYLAAGIVGGLAGALLVPDGVVLIGSSGAVAGLFGAWIAITLLRARGTPLPWRARMRIMGVALLVLPSFLTPTTSSGRPISVGSHLGGLAAGLAAGLLVWMMGWVRVPPVEGDAGLRATDEPDAGE